MNPMATGTIGRKGISSLVRQTVETIIVGLNRCRREFVFFGDSFCRMTLRTSRHSDPSLVDRRIGINLRFNAVNTVTGRAGGGIRSPPCSKHTMNAVHKLSGNIRMAGPTRLRNIGSKDR